MWGSSEFKTHDRVHEREVITGDECNSETTGKLRLYTCSMRKSWPRNTPEDSPHGQSERKLLVVTENGELTISHCE